MSSFLAQGSTWTRSGETAGYSRLREARRSGTDSTLISVLSIAIRGFLSLTVPRFYENQMGRIVGNATHAICAVVLQYLAPSSQCPCSRYVLYDYPVHVDGMLMIIDI
jgi:hypothetical protein